MISSVLLPTQVVDIELFYLKKSVLGGFLAKLSGISSICAENSYQDQIILI